MEVDYNRYTLDSSSVVAQRFSTTEMLHMKGKLCAVLKPSSKS